jgi:prepilin-type N-terminal cleavage/methylation domain-containing protein
VNLEKKLRRTTMRRKCITLIELLVTKMKRRCFTLVELLVVIGIIAVLMGILLPALNAVKRTAQRVVCGANEGGIGKAMLYYADSVSQGDFPRGGGSATCQWATTGRISAFENQAGAQYGRATDAVTITCALYLLIKNADVSPEQFVCRGDAGARIFKLSDCTPPLDTTKMPDVTFLWDFGGGTGSTPKCPVWPGSYNSYAYHMPYLNKSITPNNSFPLSSYSNPASPALADRNPYLDKNAKVYLDGSDGCASPASTERPPSWDNASNSYRDEDKTGNSACHQREGQNVLYVDAHVKFEKTPNVGISKDNIWKCWSRLPTTAEEYERLPVRWCSSLDDDGKGAPYTPNDAYLVSEKNSRQ